MTIMTIIHYDDVNDEMFDVMFDPLTVCMIETSLDLPWESSAIFSYFWKFSENVQKCVAL